MYLQSLPRKERKVLIPIKYISPERALPKGLEKELERREVIVASKENIMSGRGCRAQR